MKNLIKHFGLAIVILMLMSLVILSLPAGIVTMPVYAAGYTSVNITASRWWMAYQPAGGATWAECNAATSATAGYIASGSTYAGWTTAGTSDKWMNVKRDTYRFDLSAIPVGVQVIGIKFWLYCNRTTASTYWFDDYFGLKKANITASAPVETDWIKLESGSLVAPPKLWGDLPAGSIWISINAYTGSIASLLTPTSGNYTFVSGVSLDDTFNVPVSWFSSQVHRITMSDIKMEVSYATPAAPRVMNKLSNAADYGGALLGTENVTGVSWLTPRASFADDINGMGWRIEGNAGAAFSYSVLGAGGDLIASGNNTIKVNGYYYLYTIVPVTFEDWVKCYVNDIHGNSFTSTWGRVEPPPNINQKNMTVSAVETEYPQFEYNFSRYVIYKNGIGYLYWKTNLLLADMPNYHVKIMAGGDQANATSWNTTMEYLNSSYFQTVDPANNAMAHWRYLAFTPFISATGFNTYDGFIINVARDYSIDQTGFWQGSIRLNSDNSTLTWTDSAYYYLNDISQGVSISLAGYTVAASGEMVATITIGDHSKVGTRLRSLLITLLDDTGVVLGSGRGFVSTGVNKVTFTAPVAVGDYQVRFKFFDTTLVPDYCYIKDIHFKVSAGGITTGEPPTASGFLAWLNALLESKGMNDTAGHWIIIILLCVLVAAIIGVFGKMPLVATVIDILIFGIAIYIKWIDPWIIILLALGAGFTIWRMFKRGSSSSGAAEE